MLEHLLGSHRDLAEVVVKNWAATGTVLILPSAPCLGSKPALMSSSGVEPSLPTALLLIPVALQPAKGAHLLCVRFQGRGTQYVTRTSHSLGWISACVFSLFL